RTPWGHDAVAAHVPHLAPCPERESLELLGGAGIPVIDVRSARHADEAVVAARTLGRPVALKLDAVGLAHKTEIGGEWREVPRRAGTELLAVASGRGIDVRGLLVEPMADQGIELIVGMRRDPSFGPAVLVGLGGVYAEVLADVAIRLAPVLPGDAEAMLDELRG